jgi:hypothetical protein
MYPEFLPTPSSDCSGTVPAGLLGLVLIDKLEGTIMNRNSILKAALAMTVSVATGIAVYAQDKFDRYSLISPGGIAFSDFRGYEDWAVVSSARTDEVLKVIVANPLMIKAYKAGVPGNGQPFPEGSKIAKLQ